MARVWLAMAMIGVSALSASAQGIIGDVLSGTLVKPEVGDFAWYDLTDKTEDKRYYLRQAIVGAEKVKRKKGYWVETEVIPQVGYPAIYKMLLTGPASDPKHVHRVLLREGRNPVQEIPVDRNAKAEKEPEVTRTSLGKEPISLPDGSVIEADHLEIKSEGEKTDIWISDMVPPMGIVRLVSPDGELMLRRYGRGGSDGESAIDRAPATPDHESGVKVRVGGGVDTNMSIRKKAK